MKRRDRRQTPLNTSLIQGKSKQSSIDDMFSSDAISPDDMDSSILKNKKSDTASAFYLDGEGTSKEKSLDKYIGIISNLDVKDEKKEKKISKSKEKKKQRLNLTRVSVLTPDGKPLMPTKASRAKKWLKEGKAKVVTNDIGIFQIQLIKEPSGRNKQEITVTIDPGSSFTGVGICSKKCILYGCNIEFPGNLLEKENPKTGKKIKVFVHTVHQRMDKRRELRRSRRYRKTRRRESRFLNRSKKKIAPSILSRKQLELRVVKELTKIYPISIIGIEDIKFDHYNKRWGKNFSQVEVGKKWLFEELQKLVKAPIKLIRGFDTDIRRKQLGLKKSSQKEERNPDSHVNDCIAMGSIILGLGMERSNKFKFDVITRPRYSRRKLHLEQPAKGGIRRRYGGSTIPFSKLRKGDYVEAIQGKKIFRGWISGYTNMYGSDFIYISDFDWKGFGKNRTQTAVVPSNIRIINRNNGLLIKSLEISKDRIEICKYGTIQKGIEDAWL